MTVKLIDLLCHPVNAGLLANVLRNEMPHVTSNLRCMLRQPGPSAPICIDSTGVVVDGTHRVAAALLRGQIEIEAVFTK